MIKGRNSENETGLCVCVKEENGEGGVAGGGEKTLI